jgi:hypothetical protein
MESPSTSPIVHKEIDLEMLKNWEFPQDAIDYLFSYPDTTA